MRLRVEVFGDVQMNHELLALTGRVMDATPAWLVIMNDMERVEKQQFDTEGGYASGGWEALSERWLDFKRQNNFDLRILRMTGALFDSLTEWHSPWAVREVTPMGFAFGTRRPFAATHQRGTDSVPQRRFLELTMERREAYVRVLLGWARTGNPANYLHRRG